MRKGLKKDAVAAALAATLVGGAGVAQAQKVDAGQTTRYGVGAQGARRGRPRKFSRPSRAVTLTLPDEVISALQAIDNDLSRAVVRAIQPLPADVSRKPAELTTYGGRGVIVVPRNRALKERTGAELVPLVDGRALIAFDERLSIPQFELQVLDALADPTLEGDDRVMFQTLADILRTARQDEGVELRQQSIIVLQWTRAGAQAAAQKRGSRAESA